MTTANPEMASAPHVADSETGALSWVATVDHKRIGILYLWTALFFFAIGGSEALVIRLQLARPTSHVVAPETFNQLFTMHGTTMIFLVVMPTLVGFANYLVPLMIGARDMAFPRLNALSYWLFPFGGLLLHVSLIAGGAPSMREQVLVPYQISPRSNVTVRPEVCRKRSAWARAPRRSRTPSASRASFRARGNRGSYDGGGGCKRSGSSRRGR